LYAKVGVRPVTNSTEKPQTSGKKASDSAVAEANSSAETPEKLDTPPVPASSPGTKPLIPIRLRTDLQGQSRIFLWGGPIPKPKAE
jgi:hypothetical protein